jgi:hypothetical protein
LSFLNFLEFDWRLGSVGVEVSNATLILYIDVGYREIGSIGLRCSAALIPQLALTMSWIGLQSFSIDIVVYSASYGGNVIREIEAAGYDGDGEQEKQKGVCRVSYL